VPCGTQVLPIIGLGLPTDSDLQHLVLPLHVVHGVPGILAYFLPVPWNPTWWYSTRIYYNTCRYEYMHNCTYVQCTCTCTELYQECLDIHDLLPRVPLGVPHCPINFYLKWLKAPIESYLENLVVPINSHLNLVVMPLDS
jgi:hypothetical protein